VQRVRDKRLASKTEMEEIAWFLTTRKPGRSVGFVSAAQFREMEGGSCKNQPHGFRRTEAE
jgi:hypothetical protein